jgi:hypothetical protein
MTDGIPILNELNPYGRRVATQLFRHFPDWSTFARIDPHPNADSGALLVEISANSPNIRNRLRISTDGDELTIGLHTHHCHFADYDQRGTDEHIEDGIEYIKQLIQEDYVIHSWYCNGQFWGSVTGTADNVGDPGKFVGNVDKITCRSWAGTHDSDDVRITG